jgi:hypothetical protein
METINQSKSSIIIKYKPEVILPSVSSLTAGEGGVESHINRVETFKFKMGGTEVS